MTGGLSPLGHRDEIATPRVWEHPTDVAVHAQHANRLNTPKDMDRVVAVEWIRLIFRLSTRQIASQITLGDLDGFPGIHRHIRRHIRPAP